MFSTLNFESNANLSQKFTVDFQDIFNYIKKIVDKKLDNWGGNNCEDCDDKFVIDSNTKFVNGTAGNDEIRLTEGSHTIYGGAGDDIISAGPGDDQISGGAGNDTISGNSGNDIICGGKGNDILLGNGGNDKVYGGSGKDTLFGGRDSDFLDGGSGADRLQGDLGDDRLFGGSGSDTFIFRLGDGKDVIEDFETGRCDRDVIDLSAMGPSFDTYAEVKAAMSQSSAGVLIDFGNGQSVLLEGVRSNELSSAHFVF